MITDWCTYPIFVTIQPNFGWQYGDYRNGRSSASDQARNIGRTWELAANLAYLLDAMYQKCPRPEFLPHRLRFNGFAVMEKQATNPHLHILLSCTDVADRFMRSMFLLEILDNVHKSRRDERDHRWQREGWDLIAARGGWSDDLLWERTSSILTAHAPAGTAMVQVVRTNEDRESVAEYMSKTWTSSPSILATRRTTHTNAWRDDFRQLKDFYSDTMDAKPARNWRYGQNNKNERILDLDNPTPWKRHNGREIK